MSSVAITETLLDLAPNIRNNGSLRSSGDPCHQSQVVTPGRQVMLLTAGAMYQLTARLQTWLGPDEPGDRIGCLLDLVGRGVTTFGDGFDDAVAEVFFEQAERD